MKKNFKQDIQRAFEDMLSEDNNLIILKSEEDETVQTKSSTFRQKRKRGNIEKDSASYSAKQKRGKKKS